MTETELRELDVWIAAHVMGWKPKHRDDHCDGMTIIKCGACGRMGHSNCYGNGDGALTFKCEDVPCCEDASNPNYTADRDAAFQVLDACIKKSATQREQIAVDWRNGGYVVAQIYWDYIGTEVEFETYSESLPLAICLFAKKLFS